MEEQQHQEVPEESVSSVPYTPRPRWQVWCARFFLVIVILLIIMYYVNIATGGQ